MVPSNYYIYTLALRVAEKSPDNSFHVETEAWNDDALRKLAGAAG